MLCEYNCGNEAKYFLKRAKKWCCSESYNSCPTARKKNRNSNTGEKNHRYGKNCTEETKQKISNANKGNEPWNKGKIGVYSSDTLKKMSEVRKGVIPWNKGFKKIKKKTISVDRRKTRNIKKNKNPNWKGGYSSRNIPLYDTYADKLTIEEKPRRDGFDNNILTVICTNCKKRFIPKLNSVAERARSLKGTQSGECRLYCSDECKEQCSIFNKSLYNNINNNKIYTQNEYDQFRAFVLERDNYKCQYCGEKATVVHHEKTQKVEPFFALDPDFAWSCCEKCHYKKGHQGECSTGALASKVC